MNCSQPSQAVFPADDAFHWSIELDGHPAELIEPRPGTMTVAEEMFFLGSPLAHVVDYEEAQRQKRFRTLSGRSRAPAALDTFFAAPARPQHKALAE